jgi:hypothetical protein
MGLSTCLYPPSIVAPWRNFMPRTALRIQLFASVSELFGCWATGRRFSLISKALETLDHLLSKVVHFSLLHSPLNVVLGTIYISLN